MAAVTPKFKNLNGTDFHRELKRRVHNYFVENNKKSTGDFSLYFKAILFWTLYIGLYVHVVFFTPGAWWAIAECLVMGGLTAAIGFNVMHDGGHGSFSESPFWNKIAAFSVNGLGASALMWNNKHNIIHHTYTNIDGFDDDIEIKPMLRMCETQKKYKIHRFQHIYVWFLYTQLLIIWVFATDYTKYFKKKVGQVPLKKFSAFDHFAFWTAKIGYYAMMIVLPIYMVGFVNWLIGFMVLAMFAGFVLSVVFQLAHTVEETAFPVPVENTNNIENEWAIHQIQTTANFATKNKLISWLVGGLNFQIEHHLFPKISHIHYPEISKIIKKTCEEFNIKYIEHRKMRHALASHAMYLKKMGTA
ncbi:fatty acid desaturase family protein [Ferruginibacter yonginensis]|uniref:Fatty acid desaturase family protein n=1 Tax=Ferruginibacter yonginensis TaxID=1310416 RepID=A0ABV8QPE5_9BACT